MIPESELADLKARIPIENLIRSRGVELKPVGSDLKGLCPFHSEKTPSFTVTPSKGLYHCFGCDRGGDLFNFVMESDGVDFPEAVRRVRLFGKGAEIDGGAADREGKAGLKRPEAFARHSHYVNDALLLQHVVSFTKWRFLETARAIDYLRRRGITSPETIERFQPLFFDGKFGRTLPTTQSNAGKEVRAQLERIGIYTPKHHHERFVGHIAFPAYGEDGTVKQIVARRLDEYKHKRPRYLLLTQPHGGLFNREVFGSSKELILTEGVFDAMTFFEHGFRNVTCGFGASGFHDELFTAITRSKIKRVYIAFDNDEAGNTGAAKVAEKLKGAGIEAFRVQFPMALDANDFALKTDSPREAFTVLLNAAKPMFEEVGAADPDEGETAGKESGQMKKVSGDPGEALSRGPAVEVPVQKANRTSPLTLVKDESIKSVKLLDGDICEIEFPGRVYRIFGLSKNQSLEVMRVNIRVYLSEGYFSETIDLTSNKQQDRYAQDAGDALREKSEIFKRDLERMLLRLEDLQYDRIYGDKENKDKIPEMSKGEIDEAMRFLKSPKMFEIISDDLRRCGIVGEETNLIVMYLAATSRLLSKPIHILVQSGSASGKSTLMKAILNMIPPEDVLLYSSLTGQALFYMRDRELKHKILAIEEDRGAERADYIIKMLQTEGKANIATTIKDPGTGHMSTEDYWVEGPTSCWKTSTTIYIDEEVLNRFFVLATDESKEQTRRILEMQRIQRTFEGWEMRENRPNIYKIHHNAQRLLKPIPVVNPFARLLTFMDNRHRLRRDHEKYMSLIEAVALLRQYQKPLHKREIAGKVRECILVDTNDIRIANRLANHVLGRTLDEMPPHTRTFLREIAKLADEEAEKQKIPRQDVRLTRRQMVEYTGLSSTQVHHHLRKLIELEYVVPASAGIHRLLNYDVMYRGEGESGAPFLPGILDIDEAEKELAEELKKSEEVSGPSSTGEVLRKAGGEG